MPYFFLTCFFGLFFLSLPQAPMGSPLTRHTPRSPASWSSPVTSPTNTSQNTPSPRLHTHMHTHATYHTSRKWKIHLTIIDIFPWAQVKMCTAEKSKVCRCSYHLNHISSVLSAWPSMFLLLLYVCRWCRKSIFEMHCTPHVIPCEICIIRYIWGDI